MRQSREEAAATRERILKVASRLFREHGVDAVGVAELMRAAGLTHGGFYKHFPSKDALVAEALDRAMEHTWARQRKITDQASSEDALASLLEQYLSPLHRDHPEHGCAVAALGCETARREGEARHALSRGAVRLIDSVAAMLNTAEPGERGPKARAVAAAMMGALMLSRSIEEPELSEAVLKDTREFILKALD